MAIVAPVAGCGDHTNGGGNADLATTDDFGVGNDLSIGVDLSVPPDLAVPTDLSASVDMALVCDGDAGFKACAGACIATTECCTPSDCTSPTNGVATCDTTAHTCGIQCSPGYRACGTLCIAGEATDGGFVFGDGGTNSDGGAGELACCTSNDCPVGGEQCSAPGGSCACPSGQKICASSNSCIPSGDCCTATDCPGASNGTPTCTAGVCGISCDSGYNKCNGSCQVATSQCCAASDCSSNNISPSCTSGTCDGTCNAGFADCDNNKQTNGCEVNTGTDPNNCAACGTVCSGNNINTRTCTSGVCTGACNPGFADCDNNKQTNGCEINTGTDASNCGGCGTVCSGNNIATPTCTGGTCSGACNAGFADCNGNKQTDGCEINLKTDPGNCGGCGTVCSNNHISNPTCSNGVCGGTCDAGFADCDGNPANGCETDIGSTASACGGCGIVCSSNNIATPTCSGGVCNGACNSGFADCNGNKQTDGCETDLGSTANACGACGSVCSSNNIASPTCSGGVCNGTCNAGFADCDNNKLTNGCETNLDTTANACGACGNVCSSNNISSPTCGGGVCNGTCDAGFADCDNNKLTNGCEININSDATNCGGCGVGCSSNNVTPSCSGGVCNGACTAGFADCDNNKQTNGCEINTNSDASNCGGCGVTCSSNNVSPSCGGGVCNGACTAGFADCDNNKQTDGCEINVLADPSNCGGCGLACSTNNMAMLACGGGICDGTCSAGFADCNNNKAVDGCEINLQTDASNCGGCGVTCSTNNISAACGGGVCDGTCNAGFADCNGNKQSDGCETDVAADPLNCGGCGVTCSSNNMASQSCGSGVCDGACVAGFADCDNNKQTNGCETNLTNDVNNCGACGTTCSLTANTVSTTCSASACDITQCATDYYNVDGSYANGCECNAPNPSPSCGTATDEGTIAPGGSVVLTGILPPGSAGERWYKVAFTATSGFPPTYHPHVSVAGTGYLVDVLNASTCPNPGNAVSSCGDGGPVTSVTTWEVQQTGGDTTQPTGQGSAPFTWTQPTPGTSLFVRVHATSGQGCGAFTLTLQNQ